MFFSGEFLSGPNDDCGGRGVRPVDEQVDLVGGVAGEQIGSRSRRHLVETKTIEQFFGATLQFSNKSMNETKTKINN